MITHNGHLVRCLRWFGLGLEGNVNRLEWIKDFRTRMGVDLQTACRAWEQIEHTRNLMRECAADCWGFRVSESGGRKIVADCCCIPSRLGYLISRR